MKTALVLGASSGVGQNIAYRLAQHYDIAWAHRGRHPEGAAALANELRRAGRKSYEFKGDVGSDHEAVVSGGNWITREVPHGSIEVVVHSLSGASVGSTIGCSTKALEGTFNSLAHSFLWWIQGLHDHNMLAPGARIIALSSPCPDFYLQGSGVIGPAKAALESYVKSLAVELGPEGYRVNCIRFSTVLTPALKKVMPRAIERLETLHKSIVPAGRMQESKDVAEIVLALTTPYMYWINGAILDCTGGAVLKLMEHAFHGQAI